MLKQEEPLREIIFAELQKGPKSISALNSALNSGGVKVSRHYLSGYLKALQELGMLKENNIKPAIVYSISKDPRTDLYRAVGICARKLSSIESGNYALLILHSIFKRPILTSEIEKCGVDQPTRYFIVPDSEKAGILSRAHSLGVEARASDRMMEPENDLKNRDRIIDYLSSLILQAFNLDESHGKGFIQTKLDF